MVATNRHVQQISNSELPHSLLALSNATSGWSLSSKVLASIEPELPHRLEAIDITDEDHVEWFSKYKYDIPVLHIGDKYWMKHKITEEEARQGLVLARSNTFLFANDGDPDAGEMERRQAERPKFVKKNVSLK